MTATWRNKKLWE